MSSAHQGEGARSLPKPRTDRLTGCLQLSQRIRFVYLPKHTSWLNQIEIIFGVVMRKVIRRGNFKSVEDLRSKLSAFFAYFNEVYARPFKWTYTGRPLQV